MKITIDITQADIDAGIREDPYNCPVALAVNRAMGIAGAWVISMVHFKKGRKNYQGLLPIDLLAWRHRFDMSYPIIPGIWTMQVDICN